MQRLSHTPTQAAEEANVGRSMIFEAIREGELASVKLKNKRLILHEDLVEWLRRHRVPAK